MPLTVISAAVIFPVAFGISYSFSRRESVLHAMASLKCSAIAMYQCHREWDSPVTYAEEAKLKAEEEQEEAIQREKRHEIWMTMDKTKDMDKRVLEAEFEREEQIREQRRHRKKEQVKHQLGQEVKHLLQELFREIKRYLNNEGGLQSLYRIYILFDELFVKHEDLRKRHDWVRSVLSRPLQYHRFMMLDFEHLKIVHDYRTASTLRAYGLIFLTFGPLVMSPLFANYAHLYGLPAGLWGAGFVSFLLTMLYHVQEHIEDPFAGFGPDVINFDMLLEANHHML